MPTVGGKALYKFTIATTGNLAMLRIPMWPFVKNSKPLLEVNEWQGILMNLIFLISTGLITSYEDVLQHLIAQKCYMYLFFCSWLLNISYHIFPVHSESLF